MGNACDYGDCPVHSWLYKYISWGCFPMHINKTLTFSMFYSWYIQSALVVLKRPAKLKRWQVVTIV